MWLTRWVHWHNINTLRENGHCFVCRKKLLNCGQTQSCMANSAYLLAYTLSRLTLKVWCCYVLLWRPWANPSIHYFTYESSTVANNFESWLQYITFSVFFFNVGMILCCGEGGGWNTLQMPQTNWRQILAKHGLLKWDASEPFTSLSVLSLVWSSYFHVELPTS